MTDDRRVVLPVQVPVFAAACTPRLAHASADVPTWIPAYPAWGDTAFELALCGLIAWTVYLVWWRWNTRRKDRE